MADDGGRAGFGNAEGHWDRWDGDPARLAEYVSLDGLDRVGLATEMAREKRAATAKQRLDAAREAWNVLARKQLPYRSVQWDPRGQWVRDPRWFALDSGSCLDFTLVFAAMCIDAGVAPIIVVASTGDTNATEGHAFALIDLRRDLRYPNPRGLPVAGVVDFKAGMARLDTDRSKIYELIVTHEVVAVDVVAAAAGEGADFVTAVEQGAQHLTSDRWDQLILVDVPGRWVGARGPRVPLPRSDRPAVTRSVPILPVDYLPRADLQRNLEAVRERARSGGGAAVLHGLQGIGKSLLAQREAALAPAGWFLNASDRTTLVRSLATADNAERYRESKAATMDDAMGDALNALARLRQRGPWTVVIDNCNVDPAQVADLLPVPSAEQVLLVTTTNAKWRSWVSQHGRHPEGGDLWTVVDVGPLEDEEARTLGCPASLVELAAGRPLFARAFAAHPDAGAVAVSKAVPAGVDAAAWELWSLASDSLDDRSQAFARAASWLQPDAIPLETLQSLLPLTADRRPDELVDNLNELVAGLERLGIVTWAGGAVRIHRLVAAALRATTTDQEAVQIIGSAAFVKDGEKRIDNETLETAHQRMRTLRAGDLDPIERARALWAVMTLMEPRNQVNEASGVTESIESLLRPHAPSGEPTANILADALHARARWVHQNPRSTAQDCLAARDLMREARSLRESLGDIAAVAKSDALDALLLRKASRDLTGEEKLVALREVLAMLVESHELREAVLTARHPDTARALFNLGGTHINMAQVEPENADDHLRAAYEEYAAVLATRKELYGSDIHIHYAASLHGFALVAYYRAILVDGTNQERVASLREATRSALDGLHMRQALDASIDGADVQKSLLLLAKIADARTALSRAMQSASAALRGDKAPDLAEIRAKATKGFSEDVAERVEEMTRAGLLEFIDAIEFAAA